MERGPGPVAGDPSRGRRRSGCFQPGGLVIIPPPLADKNSSCEGGGAVFPQCRSISYALPSVSHTEEQKEGGGGYAKYL